MDSRFRGNDGGGGVPALLVTPLSFVIPAPFPLPPPLPSSLPPSVIPAQAGIQAVVRLAPKPEHPANPIGFPPARE